MNGVLIANKVMDSKKRTGREVGVIFKFFFKFCVIFKINLKSPNIMCNGNLSTICWEKKVEIDGRTDVGMHVNIFHFHVA